MAKTTTILITGAANGIGAAFVDAYRKIPSTQIIALDRGSIDAPYSNVSPRQLDITSESAIAELVRTKLNDTPLDLVIHSAGVRGLVPGVEANKPDDVAACETMDVMDMATLTKTFEINAAGTFLLFRALLPSLKLAPYPKVVVMSSRMGSVGNNQVPNRAAGSAYAYRASKAALNTIVRSFAVDEPNVIFILCHPGRVETNLVRYKEEGAIGADESVASLIPLVQTWSSRDSGGFFDRFGAPVPW